MSTLVRRGAVVWIPRRERARELLLAHGKLESTVRYLGIEVDDALALSEQIEL